MKLNEVINKADELIRKASENFNEGGVDKAIDTMVDLRELLEEPFDMTLDQKTDTQPNYCSK